MDFLKNIFEKDFFGGNSGGSEGGEATSYPINVTFMNGENVYEKTGVSSSNIKINKPDTDPEGEGVFAGWVTDSSEALETFPKNISEDTVFNAYYTETRTDMEITDANEVLFIWSGSSSKKKNSGTCITGYNIFKKSTIYYCCTVCLSRVSEDACAITGGYNNISKGTLVYGGETWYYYRDRSAHGTPFTSFNAKAYNCNIEHDVTDNEVALATLNRYFNIS